MKNKKTKLIITAFLCAAVISAGALAMLASAEPASGDPEPESKPSGPKLSERPEDFKKFEGPEGFEGFEIPEGFEPPPWRGSRIENGEFPEGFEIPEGAERHEFRFDGGKPGGCFGFGMGIGGIKGFFGSGSADIADILGLTEEELRAKILEADGNIFKVLEEAGKLEEYKNKILQGFKEKLDEQVVSGAITQEKADEAYAMLEESVSSLINGEGPAMKMPGPGRHEPVRSYKTETETRTTSFM